ncbi:GmrSD restriction endonuclease domain-containing protein [Dactylosporangium sp. CA-139114]|uniref:GmrSD restriction endonuclease domain-containing protein n=1 Tax=Dactylosporangium sp. CA-139114 TaxID=3239931 RepID=UPI003D96F699
MVAARETTLQELLEGSKQYQVPLYQRTYSWKVGQLQRLWDDLAKLVEDRAETPGATHFIGSLVLAPSPSNGPAGVAEYLIVDGQQRLTTLSILLCALRDHRAATEHAEHHDRINQQYLINKWRPEPQRLKLLPTQADRPAYLACLDSSPQAGGGDPIGEAYRFFRKQLVAADDPEDPSDIERIEEAVISGLALVSVTTQRGDNAHRIFESLNNTGLDLSQADLLRNYLFMRLPTRGEAVYASLWLPLQRLLPVKHLELLFWLDLVQVEPRVKQSDTYTAQQTRLDRVQTEQGIEAEVARLARLGNLLKLILEPKDEADPGVRLRLQRLNAWGTTTVYPLLLHLLDRRAQGAATSEQVATAMLYVESFFVRRLLIGRATANVNRILLSVVTEMRQDQPVDEAVRQYLSTGRKYYASDAEVRSAVEMLPFYLNGRPNQRALVLRWLEESYGNKEPVDLSTLTIEHVMPQSVTSHWKTALAADLKPGEEARQVHAGLVHTIGNLTLTGYNASLSNKPFEHKRPKLATSGVSMNQEIAQRERWGRPEILSRAAALAERVATIWPGPTDAGADTSIGARWSLLNQALAELPAGSWTTYGDLAALIGSHAVAVGARLGSAPAPNAHRVLQVEGTVSPNFQWTDPERSDDPSDLLRAEGVEFDQRGRANPAQRLTVDELARLVGLDGDALPDPIPDPHPGQDPQLRDRFVEQLIDSQGHGVAKATLQLLDRWTGLGGQLQYGTAPTVTSCFLMARGHEDPQGSIWPLTVYPTGSVEVVFQHLRTRAPFDDATLREEFRARLSTVPGIAIPAAKIELRPSFPLEILVEPGTLDLLVERLEWFHSASVPAPAAHTGSPGVS